MTAAHTPQRACPNCTADKATPLPAYSLAEWRVVECTHCTMVYLQNPIDYVALEEDFAWEKTYAELDQTRNHKKSWIKRAARQIRILNYRLKPDANERFLKLLGPGNVLDIGCGDYLRWRAPFVPFGIEISKAMQKNPRCKNARLGWRMCAGGRCRSNLGFPRRQIQQHHDALLSGT